MRKNHNKAQEREDRLIHKLREVVQGYPYTIMMKKVPNLSAILTFNSSSMISSSLKSQLWKDTSSLNSTMMTVHSISSFHSVLTRINTIEFIKTRMNSYSINTS